MSTIYIPGRGTVNLAHRKVDAVVNSYDERLFAAQHPETGQDTVFIKMPPSFNEMEGGLDVAGQRAYPVLSFPEGFPHPEDIRDKLVTMDSVRQGEKILRDINAHNERLRAEARYKASEAAGIFTEGLESYQHRQGITPYHRSLRKQDPKHRAAR